MTAFHDYTIWCCAVALGVTITVLECQVLPQAKKHIIPVCFKAVLSLSLSPFSLSILLGISNFDHVFRWRDHQSEAAFPYPEVGCR